jgi:hypothetical protein
VKRVMLLAILLLAPRATASPGAQCLAIPNGDTRALVWSVFEGRPFAQQTLTDAEPLLNRYGIQLTPPNASGERTKIGDPLSGHWTRVGFGEGRPVWIVEGDAYVPNACAPAPPTPPVQPTPPMTIDVSAILSKLDEIERQNDANTTRLEAAVNEPAWFKTVFSNRYVQMALAAVAGWLGTKAVQ